MRVLRAKPDAGDNVCGAPNTETQPHQLTGVRCEIEDWRETPPVGFPHCCRGYSDRRRKRAGVDPFVQGFKGSLEAARIGRRIGNKTRWEVKDEILQSPVDCFAVHIRLKRGLKDKGMGTRLRLGQA